MEPDSSLMKKTKKKPMSLESHKKTVWNLWMYSGREEKKKKFCGFDDSGNEFWIHVYSIMCMGVGA